MLKHRVHQSDCQQCPKRPVEPAFKAAQILRLIPAVIPARQSLLPPYGLSCPPCADCHGFIEGSLRSATYTLTKILKKNAADSTAETLKTILSVLKVNDDLPGVLDGEKSQSPRTRDRDYIEDLKSWIDNLDTC